MNNIVLVHGAWSNGSSWAKVAALLAEGGLRPATVRLPLTSLAADVAVVIRAIDQSTAPALLVGHGYGGVVITEAGNQSNVIGLVYVAAYAPDVGESASFLNQAMDRLPIADAAEHEESARKWGT